MNKRCILSLLCIASSIVGMEQYEVGLDRCCNILKFLKSGLINNPGYDDNKKINDIRNEIEKYINHILHYPYQQGLVQKQVKFLLKYIKYSGINKSKDSLDVLKYNALMKFIKEGIFDKPKGKVKVENFDTGIWGWN